MLSTFFLSTVTISRQRKTTSSYLFIRNEIMKLLNNLTSAFLFVFLMITTDSAAGTIDDRDIIREDRNLRRGMGKRQLVRKASQKFVQFFNKKDANRLGTFYDGKGALKLPDQKAVAGRGNVIAAWYQGFRQGLDALTLRITKLIDIGGFVLENGTYVLFINTPNGRMKQTGTYSVYWKCHKGRNPKIVFDAIDARKTVPAKGN